MLPLWYEISYIIISYEFWYIYDTNDFDVELVYYY